MKLPFIIAKRHLTTLRRSSFSTIAGIMAVFGLAIGLAALIITYSIINGFEQTISDKISSFDGHIQITHFLDSPFPEGQIHLDSLLAPYRSKVRTIPFLQHPLIFRKGAQAEGGVCIGLPPDTLPVALQTLMKPTQQKLRPGTVILGDRLAEALNASVGDKVVLMQVDLDGGFSKAPQYRTMTVLGLIHSGLLDYDRSVAYLPLIDLQAITGIGNRVSGVMLYESDTAIHRSLYKALQNGLNYPFYALSWKDKHHVLYEWMTVQRWPILIIFGLIALVGIVNIISALMMIILEKTRQVGILKAQGLPPKGIRKIFLTEGLLISITGTVLGALLAFGLIAIQTAYNVLKIPEDVYFMDKIPVQISWRATAIILVAGILLSLAAVLWPVKRAVEIEPAKALRYE